MTKFGGCDIMGETTCAARFDPQNEGRLDRMTMEMQSHSDKHLPKESFLTHGMSFLFFAIHGNEHAHAKETV